MLRNLLEDALRPDRALPLEKTVRLAGEDVHLLALTEQAGVVRLWTLRHCPRPEGWEELEYREFSTNREQMRAEAEAKGVGIPNIASLHIGDIRMDMPEATNMCLQDSQQAAMALQHFFEAGLDFSRFLDAPLDELYLTWYTGGERTRFPDASPENLPVMRIRTGEETEMVLLEAPLRFTLEEGDQPDSLHALRIPETGEEIKFYLGRVHRDDIRAKMPAMWDTFSDEESRPEGMSDEQIAGLRREHRESMDELCPEGHELLLLEYAVKDGHQLLFRTTAFLDSPPARNSSGVMFLALTDDNAKRLGYTARTEILRAVPKGEVRPVEVELIAWYRTTPSGEILVP